MNNKIKSKKTTGFMKSNYIRAFLKKYKFNYLLGVISLIVVDIAQTRVPIIVGSVIDQIESKNFHMTLISSVIIKLVSISIAIYIGRIAWRFFIFGTGRSIEKDIRNDMFLHLEKMSSRYFQDNTPGEIMAYMTNDLEAVRMALGPGILFLIDVLAMGTITLYSMIVQIDPLLTLAGVVPLLLIAVSVRIMGRENRKRFRNKQEAFAELSKFVQEQLTGIKVIKSFVQEEKTIDAFERNVKRTYEKNMHLIKIQSLMHPFMQFISGLALAVAIGYGGYITIKQRITLGDFTAFIQYLSMLVWPMVATGMTINIFASGAASLERVESILNEPVEIKDSENLSNIDTLLGSIEVKNLNYKYPNTENQVLKNINFKIEKGQTLGIIGRTGSGKTTLVTLLLRLFDVDKNTVFINGEDLLNIPLKLLRENIGYVPQDNFLFSDTIKNNIDFGVRKGEMDKIIEAAKDSVVHENIIDFKDGYETVVGERGVVLSGGQKQRISIARALIKNPEILILDDSVSAVDTDTEEKILKHLNEKRKGKTNIIIAHRISTIQNSDKIIVLDDGKIVESGTHKELVHKKGLYHSIYEKQLLEKMLEEQK